MPSPSGRAVKITQATVIGSLGFLWLAIDITIVEWAGGGSDYPQYRMPWRLLCRQVLVTSHYYLIVVAIFIALRKRVVDSLVQARWE